MIAGLNVVYFRIKYFTLKNMLLLKQHCDILDSLSQSFNNLAQNAALTTDSESSQKHERNLLMNMHIW